MIGYGVWVVFRLTAIGAGIHATGRFVWVASSPYSSRQSTDLDWVILRPSALTNEPSRGTVDLGLAKVHEEITRDDVAANIVKLLKRPGVNRIILEATGGATPIKKAVALLS